MFDGANKFNANLGKWDTSRVRNMNRSKLPLLHCLPYKYIKLIIPSPPHTTSWLMLLMMMIDDVFLVLSVFSRAKEFNSNLEKWDTSRVTDMHGSKSSFL